MAKHASVDATTLNAWLDDWLAGVGVSNPRSMPTYRRWMAHVRPTLGETVLAELSTAQLLTFFAAGLRPKLAPTSRRHVYAVLHTALNAAVERELIVVNPLSRVPKPPGYQAERPTLTDEECRRLIATCAADRLGALVTLAIYSGARLGELLALTWRDIDWERSQLKVNKSMSCRDGPITVSSTKTRAGRRVVSLPPAALEALQRHREAQTMERLAARVWATDSDLVFCTTTGSPLRQANFSHRYWHPLLTRARLPQIHFHDLRHTSALMAMRSGHLTAVSRRLGHSTTGITAELYGHATSADDERIADKMAAMLAGGPSILQAAADPAVRPVLGLAPASGFLC